MRSKLLHHVPLSALSADSKINSIRSKIDETPVEGGKLLGIIEPIWVKAAESEVRIAWLGEMLDRGLVSRDIEIFGRNTIDKLRSESALEDEMGRDSLMELMRVKWMDEKRYYREYKKIREKVRDWTRCKIGKRRYDRQMAIIKRKIEKTKKNLMEKFKKKVKHLEEETKKEKEKMLEIVPSGLEKYSGCAVFNKEKMSKMRKEKIGHEIIGKVEIDEDEKSILDQTQNLL